MQIGDYIIKPSSKSSEQNLMDFLKFNSFSHDSRFENHPIETRELVIVVNVINRTYFNIDKFFVPSDKIISEAEFLNGINYCQEKNIEYEKIYNDEGMVYEGYVRCGKPYGLGIAYYPNGNIYREGVFDIKGIIMGKEYYSSGQLKFVGIWRKNMGYGPNYPILGNYYSENGELIFSGKFEVKKGGVGYPMMKYPRYKFEEKDRPEIEYL